MDTTPSQDDAGALVEIVDDNNQLSQGGDKGVSPSPTQDVGH